MPLKILRNKSGVPVFLLSLALSCGVWLTHNLSLDYTDIVSVPVVAVSNIDSRASVSSNEVQVASRCSGSGFYILSHRLSSSAPVSVTFAKEDFTDVGGGDYALSQEALERHFADIFGTNSSLVSLISRNVVFHFAPEACRKVPVKAFCTASFKPQFMALSPITITPDSVFVYGEPEMLESVDAVLTRQFVLKDLSADAHGSVELRNPGGVRLSAEKADYSLEVGRYVEMSTRVRVNAHNAPSSAGFEVYPVYVDVVFRCRFPFDGNPVDRMEFYVDYNDFESSINGKCVIRHGNLPPGVISCRVSPPLCECVNKEEER